MVAHTEGKKELSVAIDEMMGEKIGVYTADPVAITEEVPFDDMAVVDLSADYEEEE